MDKVIIINNNDDYKKFLKKIKYYKTIFFKKIKFKVENNMKNNEIDIIVEALNKKRRKEQNEYVYDEVCKFLDDKGDLNICGFKNNKCIVQRKNKSKRFNGCCLTCKHQKNHSCDTKNLTCKLFYCPTIKRKYKIYKMRDINLLKLFSIRQKYFLKFDFFSSREEVLKDLNSYGVIITSLRIVNRQKVDNKKIS